MVQVENEIGMIPDSRDRSAAAEKLYKQTVPAELITYLEQHKETLIPEFRSVWATNGFKTRGTWEDFFGAGPRADEIFMAWYFARYVNRVAEAGAAQYKLPMFVNAALIRPGYQPGQYPSAGPLPHLMDVWRAGAPQIDFLSPDIYFTNFAEWALRYQQLGNPVFIPEAAPNPVSAVNAFWAVSQLDAIGFSPFAIESVEEPVNKLLTGSYDVLKQLGPLILEHQGKREMFGFLPEGPEQRQPLKVRLAGYALNVAYPPAAAGPGAPTSDVVAGGFVISIGPDEFIFAGTGLTITFETETAGNESVGLLSVEEGRYVNGTWTAGRRLNGDQTNQGRHVRLPPGKFDIQRVKLYRYR
jgi:beta-galactosidase GanA